MHRMRYFLPEMYSLFLSSIGSEMKSISAILVPSVDRREDTPDMFGPASAI